MTERETFGGTVTLIPDATYPIHVNGLGGHSVADARALRNDLDGAIRGAECLASAPAGRDVGAARTPEEHRASMTAATTLTRWIGPDGIELPPQRDGYPDEALRRASDAVAKCFAPGADVEPTRSREFFTEVAHCVLASLSDAPGEPSPPADTRPRAEHPCPDCGGEVLRVDHAMDPSDYQCRDQFDCCWTSETPPSSSTAGW